METREGKLETRRGRQGAADTINWKEIFDHPETIFTLMPDEYSKVENVRSAGEGYKLRNELKGTLHVLEQMEEKVDIQWDPADAEQSEAG